MLTILLVHYDLCVGWSRGLLSIEALFVIVKTLWTFVSSSRKQQIVLANVTSLREAPDNLSLVAGHTDLGPVLYCTVL